jgi:hypothetical protein
MIRILLIAEIEFILQNRLINTVKSKLQTQLPSGRGVISYLVNAVKSKDVDRLGELQNCQRETPMVIGDENVKEI